MYTPSRHSSFLGLVQQHNWMIVSMWLNTSFSKWLQRRSDWWNWFVPSWTKQRAVFILNGVAFVICCSFVWTIFHKEDIDISACRCNKIYFKWVSLREKRRKRTFFLRNEQYVKLLLYWPGQERSHLPNNPEGFAKVLHHSKQASGHNANCHMKITLCYFHII